MDTVAEQIICWFRERVNAAESKGVVIGLSGGLDSTVVSLLCKSAFPDSCLVLILPCHSSRGDIKDAEFVAKHFDLKSRMIDLSEIADCLYELIEGKKPSDLRQLPLANLYARLRMLTLYYFANKLNYLVVGTGTKSEISIGYFTKFGDGACDLLPLGNMFKTDVVKLAKALHIPERIIRKPPSAGLWKGQTDKKELGLNYEEIDEILEAKEENAEEKLKKLDSRKIDRVVELMEKTEHKRRQTPKFQFRKV
jgi:NAD+ synthase